ncbi:MAG: hypothetical protein ACN6O3_17780 [Comamonas sp.]
MRLLAWVLGLLKLLASVLMLAGLLWGASALWFRLAGSISSAPARALILGVWVGGGLLCIAMLWQRRKARKGLVVYGTGFAAIALWWIMVHPGPDRPWAPLPVLQLVDQACAKLRR